MRNLTLVLSLALALPLAACRACHVDASFFPSKIGLPAGLAALRPGMSAEQATHAIPDLHATTFRGDPALRYDEGPRDTSILVLLAGGYVGDVLITKGSPLKACPDNEIAPLLAARWGAPTSGDTALISDAAWFDRESGWLVTTRPCGIRYTNLRALAPAMSSTVLGELRWGMSRAEVARLVPALTQPNGSDDRWYLPGHDLEMWPTWTHDVLTSVVVQLPVGAAQALPLAWGTGHAVGPPHWHATVWLDRSKTIRAVLNGVDEVAVGSYVPTDRWLGPGPTIAELPAPILGRTLDELPASYVMPLPGTISLPPTEWTHSDSILATATDTSDRGVVTSYGFILEYDRPQTRAALLELANAKWRPAAPCPYTNVVRCFDPGDESITISDTPADLGPGLEIDIARKPAQDHSGRDHTTW